MATRQNDSSWMISQLLTAAEKFTFADGKADIDETKALIGLVHPFSAKDNDLALFEKLLASIAEDGVVTSDESAALARAIARLRDKYRAGEAVYDARTLGIPKMAVLGVQHMFAMFGATSSPSGWSLRSSARRSRTSPDTSRSPEWPAVRASRTATRRGCSSTPASASRRRRSCTS